MNTQAKWIFVLIGDNNTGKTGFQKKILKHLAGEDRDPRLDCNLSFPITHPNLIRKIRTLSIGNRSIQEKLDVYTDVDNYFANHFKDADICIISTHLNLPDAEKIVMNCHRKFYNVCAVFFTNSILAQQPANAKISELNWNDRWIVENPPAGEGVKQNQQLDAASNSFMQMLIERTRSW